MSCKITYVPSEDADPSSLISVIAGHYEGPAKSFVTGFVVLQCYVLSNIFLLQTFKVSPFNETHFCNLFTQSRKADK